MTTLALILSSAAFASSIAATVAGLFNLRGTRLQQLRDRQIAAADDFASAANNVLIPLTAKTETLGEPDLANPEPWLDAAQEIADEARAAAHSVTAHLARIELLFRVGSPAAQAAVGVAVGLLKATDALRDRAAGAERIRAFSEAYGEAADAFGRFNSEANLVVAQSGWRKLGRRKPQPAALSGSAADMSGV